MTHRLDIGTEGMPVPSVLIADDDAASRRFLLDALRILGAEVEAAADGTEAIALAKRRRFDLMLIDCRMPGAGAREVLDTLRHDPAARSRPTIAVATTAELGMQDRRQLLANGFSEVLIKPCQLSDLQRLLGLVPRPAEQPLLDDAAAMLASGDSGTMLALRQLLQQELIAVCGELDHLVGDTGAFRERLHRLRSSCGFCGATALSGQVVTLQQQLSTNEGDAGAALAHFRHVLVQTLEALEQPRQTA